jgi:hypothetical protein
MANLANAPLQRGSRGARCRLHNYHSLRYLQRGDYLARSEIYENQRLETWDQGEFLSTIQLAGRFNGELLSITDLFSMDFEAEIHFCEDKVFRQHNNKLCVHFMAILLRRLASLQRNCLTLPLLQSAQ